MEMTAVVLAVDRGPNNAGEVVGLTHDLAQRLCSELLSDGTARARLASSEEVEASRGKPPLIVNEERIQVRLMRDYRNNTIGDDPWYPKKESLTLIARGGAIRMPEPDPDPDPDPGKSKKGAVASRKTAVPKRAVEK